MKKLFQLAVGVKEIQISYPREGNGSIILICHKRNNYMTVNINSDLGDRNQDKYWDNVVEYIQKYLSNRDNHALNYKFAPI